MNAHEITNFLTQIQSIINKITSENPEAFFLLGDFNDSCLTWASSHKDSELKNKFVDLIQNNNLHQIIDDPTHITSTSSTLIDLIITDAPGYIINSGTKAPLGDKHHCRIFCTVNIPIENERAYKRKIWNYERGNFEMLTQNLAQAPWGAMEIYDDVDDATDYFEKLFLTTAHDYIPSKLVTIRPRDKPWFTNDVRRAFRKRDRAHKTWKTNKTPANYEHYNTLRHEANLTKHAAKENYNSKLSDRLIDPNTSSKQYWHITKQLYGSKVQRGIPPLIKNGKVHTSSTAKCNIFNKTFTDKARLPDTKPNLPPLILKTNQQLELIQTNEEEVLKCIKNLDIKKASGPDGISNRLLKNTVTAITKPLSKLFNLSLSSGKFPSQWKKANVSPIYKKNDRQNDNNYRPISLLSCIGKLLERIVFMRVYEFCMNHNLLTWRNSGYKHLDSTINQLTFLSHQIYHALSQGLDICFVSLDASSAFDRVWHKGLLFKLERIGITGRLLLWFTSYLTERMQRVVIGGSTSEWIYIKAGVPQGSILGPLLFLIYVDDIIDNIDSEILLFADDTSLLKVITDNDQSITDINRDLETLRQWSENWLVNFNPTKTKYMIFSKKLIRTQYNNLHIGDTQLEEVVKHKQLGITFSNSMTWEHHIQDICTRAGSRVDLIRRLPTSITPLTKLHIYTTFVRPLLEYGSVLFDSCTNALSEKLEGTQRQAALSITRAYQHTSSPHLLTELGLETLNERRKNSKIILIYKIRHNLTPDYMKTLIPGEVGNDTNIQTRNAGSIKNLPKTGKKQPIQNYLLKSFIPSAIKLWNNIPPNIRQCNELDTFKTRLQIYNKKTDTRPYKPYLSNSSTSHIYLSRIRMGLSGLNSHRKKYHFIDHNNCPQCNTKNENEIHYFLHCTNYAAHRQNMIAELTTVIPQHSNLLRNFFSNKKQQELCEILIRGTGSCDVDKKLFIIVSKYINNTGRFDYEKM